VIFRLPPFRAVYRAASKEVNLLPILSKLLGKPNLWPPCKLAFEQLTAQENEAAASKIARYGKFVVRASVKMGDHDPVLDLGVMDIFHTRGGAFKDWPKPTLWAISKHRSTIQIVLTSENGLSRYVARGYEFRMADPMWGDLPQPLETPQARPGAVLCSPIWASTSSSPTAFPRYPSNQQPPRAERGGCFLWRRRFYLSIQNRTMLIEQVPPLDSGEPCAFVISAFVHSAAGLILTNIGTGSVTGTICTLFVPSPIQVEPVTQVPR
jgi:hypothetical protein